MSFPKYPEYKDSGVEWLGEVPGHWAVAAVAHRYEVLLGKMLDEKRITGDHLAPYLRNVDVQWDRIAIDDLPQMDFAGGDLDRFRLVAGDLMVCEGGEVGRAALWRDELPECYYQKALHRLRPRESDRDVSRFMFYVLRMATGRGVFDASGGKSTIAHLPAEALRRFRFAYPPSNEQSLVATFLNRETVKIDALVEEQQRLIVLLKEKRQAVISQAVTKGLDPNVPMKDSGVEWLGKVPVHWDVAALNFRYEVMLGKMLDEKRVSGDHLAPYLRNVDVQWDRINTDDLPQMDFTGDDFRRYGLVPGDLLVCEGGDVGRAAIWQGEVSECFYQKALHRLRRRDVTKDKARFMFYILRMATSLGVFEAGGGKSTIAHLTAEALRRYRFAFPHGAEQEEIAAFLDNKTSALDALVAEAESASRLLQERRAALISAAVTGKIDVRGLAA